MKTVSVLVKKLTAAIRDNRKAHVETFTKAFARYRACVIDQMQRNLVAAETGGPLECYIRLSTPENHAEDYDRVLSMLDFHTEQSIDIIQDDFARYVMDDWQWKRQWQQTTSEYIAERKD